jgi:hypothetical protein
VETPMTSAIFYLPSYETYSDNRTWKMHKENPQMTQIGVDKKINAKTYSIRLNIEVKLYRNMRKVVNGLIGVTGNGKKYVEEY